MKHYPIRYKRQEDSGKGWGGGGGEEEVVKLGHRKQVKFLVSTIHLSIKKKKKKHITKGALPCQHHVLDDICFFATLAGRMRYISTCSL